MRIAVPRTLPSPDDADDERRGACAARAPDRRRLHAAAGTRSSTRPRARARRARRRPGASTSSGVAVRPRVVRERRWYQVVPRAAERLTHGMPQPRRGMARRLGVFGLRSLREARPGARSSRSRARCDRRSSSGTSGRPTAAFAGRRHAEYPVIRFDTSSERLARRRAVACCCASASTLSAGDVSMGSKGRTIHRLDVTGRAEIADASSRAIGGLGRRRAAAAAADHDAVSTTASDANTNRDVIPRAAWRTLVKPATRSRRAITTRPLQAALDMRTAARRSTASGLGRRARGSRRRRSLGSAELESPRDKRRLLGRDRRRIEPRRRRGGLRPHRRRAAQLRRRRHRPFTTASSRTPTSSCSSTATSTTTTSPTSRARRGDRRQAPQRPDRTRSSSRS